MNTSVKKQAKKAKEFHSLEEIANFLCNLSDDEFIQYFYEGSPSFRRDYDNALQSKTNAGKCKKQK